MEQSIADLVVYLCGAGLVGLATAVIMLWHMQMRMKVDLAEYKIKVAEEYMKHNAVDELTKEMHRLRDVVYRIALKMDVPVVTDQHWR